MTNVKILQLYKQSKAHIQHNDDWIKIIQNIKH